MQIFKIQLPLAGDMSMALVYNENKGNMFLLPITDALVKLIDEHGDSRKRIFVYGQPTSNSDFSSENVAPVQEW